MSNSFKTKNWDPILIISQIISIQLLTYFFASVLLFFESFIFGTPLSLDYLFDVDYLNSKEVSGWVIMMSSFVVAAFLCLSIRIIVERSKLCLDFTCTFYFFYLINCTLYSHFPSGFFWWLTVIINIIVVSIVSERLCMKKELEPIKLSGTSKPSQNFDSEEIEMNLINK
ncbi:hypothetical protein BCR32DRAFT_296223 [Anaeromyces robustus]|uniref:Integral membrane protein n=1 Tax=Anaeromyces robustus TaxID=1754192 RepID=A0A1Y1WSF2_9FUNG|nr:hypothetical protein BCR32DRAFT_296223 [Anaeromyces robustus]|eukprot:ORX76463.1 hypothetical protein BCR32DRAFT_296223 [Anaeromyces robustus]